jgi:hypothetical protein
LLIGLAHHAAPVINLEAPIMDEGDRSKEQSAGFQQNTQPAAGGFSSSASEWLREWGMACPQCQSQNAKPFMTRTLSGRKMTIPPLRMWACLNPTCLHKWPRELDEGT